ncbi:MAG: LuxR family transcriptional regulator [Solirubrobacterales bacterium]|jgi:DNA-binding CsgD family transcriptional regulator|nr:LuxR family transcriptional regulator [Solirubrobacterales bacterium]
MSLPHEPHHDRREPHRPGGLGRVVAEADGDEPATAILLAVAQTLTAWDGFERASERLLGELAGALGLAAGALWLPAGEALVASSVWSASEDVRSELERALKPVRLAPGDSLPGSAWQRREPIHLTLSTAEDSAPAGRGRPGGLRGHVAVPVCAGEEVLGVVELYARSHADLSARLIGVLGTAGHLLGTVFARRRGELNLSPLTARELEVLALAADGLTGRRIAERLQISPSTVKTHFEHIFRRLGVRDRTSAVAQAIRGGLIA